MEGQSLEEKQAYLRSEIIGGGIDAEAFMVFMGRAKNEGDNIDLDNWSLQELSNVVLKFKAESQDSQQPEPVKVQRKANIFESVIASSKEKVLYQQGSWDFECQGQQECVKCELKFPIKEGMALEVKIQKYEVRNVGGFIFGIGSKNELEMTLSTNFTNCLVIRKCEDFDWLRQILLKRHPGCFIPPLEAFRAIEANDKDGISVKVAETLRFINSLMKFDYSHTSPVVETFFKQISTKKFGQYKNRHLNLQIKKDLSSISNNQGKFTCEVSERMLKFCKSTNILSNDLSMLYTELGKQVERAVLELENQSRTVRNMETLTGKICERYNQMQKQFSPEQFKSPGMFSYFSNLLSTMNKNIRRNMRDIKSFICQFIKNSERDWVQFVANDKRRQAEQQAYIQRKISLLKKKERCYSDMTKWEIPESLMAKYSKKEKISKEEAYSIMLPSENIMEVESRIWLAFLNQNYKKTLKVLIREQEKDMQSFFLKYTFDYLALTEENSVALRCFGEMMAT